MIRRRHHADAEAFEKAWAGRATRNAEIADLVACAEQLCRTAVVEPSDEFRTSLRVQLMTEAATVLAPTRVAPTRVAPIRAAPIRAALSRPRRSPVHTPSLAIRRRLAGATAALVGAAGFVGMVGASAQALPGEMLYPVKRGVESVELAFHKDDLTRGEFRLTHASERLAEARRLTDGGSPQSQDQVAGVLDDFADQAKDGSGALFRAYGQNGSERFITVVNDFSAAAAADLALLSGQVPSDADDSFQAAADTVSQIVTKASTLCTSCGAADVTGLAGAITSLPEGSPASEATSGAAEPATTSSSSDDPASVSDPASPKLTVPELPIIQTPTQTSPTQTSPTQEAPQRKDISDPAVGALLGDEEQPGLVGDLVDGLLGAGQN
ncbi:MAG: DUF5667 domain-containing protein [Aeromicrobium sp.]